MAYSTTIYKLRHMEHVARITLNRPEKMNALSGELLDEFFACLAEAEDDDEVRVVMIKGAGRCFCPGYDIGISSRSDVSEGPPLSMMDEVSVGPSSREVLAGRRAPSATSGL